MKQQEFLEIIEQNKSKHRSSLETLIQGRKLSSDNKKDSHDYLTFVAKENGTFTFTPSSSNVISYSTDDGSTWTEGNSISVSNGDKVMWKGEMTPQEYSGIGTFSATSNFDVQGNAMSLFYGDNYKGQTDLTGKNYAFYQLFYNNTKIVNAENLSLPATTLANNCYESMFQFCTNLTTAPVLPATTLAEYCYRNMFQNCRSLTTAPALPATTLVQYCYIAMFYGCTSLVTAPELPATTLANGCYSSMFSGCTALTTAPELPATTMTYNCYREMFKNCTSLTTAPDLPATTLYPPNRTGDYDGITAGCYYQMFYGCSSLNYIKAMFIACTWTQRSSSSSSTIAYCTKDWVTGVSANGTFVKNSSATWNITGVNGVPLDWTVETTNE